MIGRKRVDWSCFEYGTTIPQAFAQRFFDVNGEVLPQGASRRCTLIHNGHRFEAEFRSVDVTDRTADTVQLIYRGNSEIQSYLRRHFRYSYERILTERERRQAEGKKRPPVVLDDDEAEYIDFLA